MFWGHWSRPSAMFGSSLGDLALRRVWDHRTHRSRMSSTSLRRTPFSSLAYAELRSRFASRFIVLRCLQKPAWSPSRGRVSSLRTKSQKKLSTAALRTFRSFFPAIFTAFQRLLLWGSACRCLLASSLCCHVAFISASTPGPAHQPCAPRGRLERGTSSAEVESMTSAMSVAMSQTQMTPGIGGSASTITGIEGSGQSSTA